MPLQSCYGRDKVFDGGRPNDLVIRLEDLDLTRDEIADRVTPRDNAVGAHPGSENESVMLHDRLSSPAFPHHT